MRRRSFIKALCSLPTIPVAAKLGVLEKIIPVMKREMFWRHVKFTGFKSAMDSTDLVGQFIGERSDGQFFYVNSILRNRRPEEIPMGSPGLRKYVEDKVIAA